MKLLPKEGKSSLAQVHILLRGEPRPEFRFPGCYVLKNLVSSQAREVAEACLLSFIPGILTEHLCVQLDYFARPERDAKEEIGSFHCI